MATVALLVGSIMAGQAASVKQAGWRLLAAVATLHAGACGGVSPSEGCDMLLGQCTLS